MANTTIQLKKSSTPSAKPTSLEFGELAINYADGKLYYKNTNSQIAEISGSGVGGNSFGTVNANSVLIIADIPGDVLTLEAGQNITIVGDAVNDKLTIGLSNDLVVPGLLTISAASGDEGGEIKLANAITNSVLSGKVVVDVYQNKLRFFEESGTNRGAYINLASASTGVGTDLLASASATDTTARNWASAAYNQANTSLTVASAAFDKANAANVLAFNTGIGANAYAVSIGAASNSYAEAIGAAGNSYTNSVGTAGNNYTVTVGAASNNWANTISATRADASNSYAVSIGVAANNWANTKLSNSTGTFAGSLTITGDLVTQGNVTLGDASTDTITLNGSTISLGNNQSIDSGTLFVDATNNRVGIGTTSPISKFHIVHPSTDGLRISNDDGVSSGITLGRNSNDGYFDILGQNNVYGLRFRTGGTSTDRFAVDLSGNVSSTGAYSTTSGKLINGLSTAFYVSAGLPYDSGIQFRNASIGSKSAIQPENGALLFYTNANNTNFDSSMVRMFISNTGNVGIGTASPIYKLEVAGSFAAQTKSFVIDHHTKPYSKLVHGSLEGPENGVYYRGKSKKKTIELPDYWSWLVDEKTITVNLTPIGKKQDLFVKEIKDNKVIIGGARTVEYYYTVYAERKDVPKLIVEC